MDNMISGFAEVNSTRLYYEMAGAGRAVIWVHGFALDTRMWDAQFEFFAQHYQVVRYDLRGFGKSALPSEPYSHYIDLKALMTHLGIERANLIGLSLGGRVVSDFALAYPESIRSLVMVDGLFGAFHWSAEWDAQMDHIWDVARENGIPAAKKAWLEHPMFQPILDYPEAARRLARMVEDFSGWHFVNENPAISLKPPAGLRLGEIKSPALITLGERDVPDFHIMADEMARQIPGARKLVLPHAGHMSNMENPEFFNEKALEFLAGV